MRRFIKALALCALLAPPAAAHADPEIPDINAYPRSEQSFVVTDNAGDPGVTLNIVGGFHTDGGLTCQIWEHFGMFSLNCWSERPWEQNGENHVILMNGSPAKFDKGPVAQGLDVAENTLYGMPLKTLPAGQRYGDVERSVIGCITNETYRLACTSGTGAGARGFVISDQGSDIFGPN